MDKMPIFYLQKNHVFPIKSWTFYIGVIVAVSSANQIEEKKTQAGNPTYE